MIPPIDIYRSAQLVRGEHGDQALDFALARSRSFLEKGDEEGSFVWGRIADAIKVIEQEQAPGPLH